MGAHAGRLALAGALALMASCDQSVLPDQSNAGKDLVRSPDGFRDFGDYIVYVNAVETGRLTADVARQHGIARSRNRALLTVSIHRKQQGAVPIAVRGDISVSAVNLTGQLKSLALREIVEGEAVYYLGEVAINNGETLVYTIDVSPGEEIVTPLSLRYQKQFFVE